MSLRPRIRAILGDCYRESAWNRDLLRITSITKPNALPACSSSSSEAQSVALVSDAGTPLISDPGWRLVQRRASSRHRRRARSRARCAAIAALCAAGLPTDHFVFEGFLPRRESARAERLECVAPRAAHDRVLRSRASCRGNARSARRAFGDDRRAAIARELTKTARADRDGHAWPSSTQRLGASIPLLGEFVIVVAGAAAATRRTKPRRGASTSCLRAELVAGQGAEARPPPITGVSRNALYRLDAHVAAPHRKLAAACAATRTLAAGVGRAVAGVTPGGKSGLYWAGCQVTPGRREPTESATENIPPAGNGR